MFQSAKPGDIDSLIQQLKDTARKVGLPAGDVDRFLKHKTDGTFEGAGLVGQSGTRHWFLS